MRANPIFYSQQGLRFLHLAAVVFPASPALYLRLGIVLIANRQWEGLHYLHRANQLASPVAPIQQALYLAYRDVEQPEVANYWLKNARDSHQQAPQDIGWKWGSLSYEAGFTYVPFESDMLLAVLPSFHSIVTTAILAAGDWFEAEIEFWRNWIQPGAIAIDVGANVGVYTFSAAQQVGKTGKVFAIEPFSECVCCLQESCRINEINWVEVRAGAASDRIGTARLSLKSSSELNELLLDTAVAAEGTFEEVSCFTLDSLIEEANLDRVDILKIDAEGHELAVLRGSDRLLSEFAPVILYENIAAGSGSNLAVAKYLREKGYQLFRYQPYVQQLVPIESDDELAGNLNAIALPPNYQNRDV
ncbi:MAG: FkbM family methyltransferase [Coleofasciculaceae cyanobacterium SM2_3_26]|nr:FkbM family methyltransferase [Coleofasciculaceae cyanobacterium SM2_3_26]